MVVPTTCWECSTHCGALATLEEIELLGLITSSSVAPFNKWVSPADFTRMAEDREEFAHGLQPSTRQRDASKRGRRRPARRFASLVSIL